jgi:nucleotide-binding universal stress UspA family protein
LTHSGRDQQLMTAVVEEAERAGTSVVPLILPTNNPLHAVMKTAKDIQAQELVVGASRRAEKQLDQIALYWSSLNGGQPPGLTVHILSADRDMYLDLEGGSRIPNIGERKARSISELREAGVGVDRVLLVHDGTPDSSDLFKSVLTMLDADVVLDFVAVPPVEHQPPNNQDVIQQDQELAKRLKRELEVHLPDGDLGPAIVKLAREGCYDLIVLSLLEGRSLDRDQPGLAWMDYLLQHAHCPVFLAAQPVIPTEATE